jgi:S1-C subfamily serine protease
MNIEIFTVGTIVIDNKVNGSAFVLTNPNFVVTCAHVLTPNKTYFYKPQSVDSLYILKPIFVDIEKDLALLECEKNIVTRPLNPVREFDVKPGQHLFYMGFNKNVSKNGTPVFQVDNAQVSSIGITKIGSSLIDFIEFNGVGIPGYSGGPVFNDDGDVVGLMREAWQKQGVKGGEILLINRAFSIVPIIDKIPVKK